MINPNTNAGWQCTVCGQWIYAGLAHVCGGSQSFPLGSVSIPPCRAPWIPLTADMVRLIIREELERMQQAGKTDGTR